MEKRCAQSSSSLALPVASRPATAVAVVGELRAGREGTAAGSAPSPCGPAAAANVLSLDVTARMPANAVSYGGAAAVLPHTRRPSPRCFVPALSRRLAAAASAAEPSSLMQLTSRHLQTAAMAAALPPANSSSTWGAATSRKRTCMEDSHCCFPTVGMAPPSLGKGSGDVSVEPASSCVSSSNNIIDLGKHITADTFAAGSNRTSNSSVSTTAAAASSWGASSEDGGEGTSEQQQQNEQEEQRPTKLFRSAMSRDCFSESLAADEDDSTHPPIEGKLLLPEDTNAPQTSAAGVVLPGRSTSLPLLSSVTSREQAQQQAESASSLKSPAAAPAATEAAGGTTSNSQANRTSSAAGASSKKTLVSSNIRRACAAARATGGGRLPSAWMGSGGALTGSSVWLKQQSKSGAVASAEKARHLKLQQQQAKLPFKAVAALAAARGTCSIADATAARGEEVRRNEKRHHNPYSFAATSSYLRPFPLSEAAVDAAGALSSRNGSSIAEKMLHHQQPGFASCRGARGLRSVLACSSSTAAGAVERSAVDSHNNSREGEGPRCISLTRGGGGNRVPPTSSITSMLQQRGTMVGSAAGLQPKTTPGTAAQFLDRTFGSVSARCRLLICDTSAAYGEDAGLDNVHNTKLAQFCYDQAAFKADKAQPGDYTANSRRLTPEGRDLLVCVVNKVAAQLAQNTAATAAASSSANGSSSSASSSSSQARADGSTTPASDPLSPRAAATVAIAIQLFDRFMQVVYQNDLHYGIAAEHCLHPLHGLSALAGLPATAAAAGSTAGATGTAAASAATPAGLSGTVSSSSHQSGTTSSNCVSYSLLNQLIAIACFCFADRVEAIYAYEYAAVLEAWRQQSPAGLTQAWKLAAIAAAGGGQLSTALLKEKLMHIERKIISHVPPNGGNVSVAPLSELAETLLNVAIQFAAADASSTGSSTGTGEDGALSEASTAPSPTSVSKSKENNRTDSILSRKNKQQQQHTVGSTSCTKQQVTAGLSLLQRRAVATSFSDPAEKRESEVQQDKQQPSQGRKKQMLLSRVVGRGSAAVTAAELSPVSRCTGGAMASRGNSGRRVLSAAWGACRGVAVAASFACAAAAGAATKQKCRCCQREWLPSPGGEEAALHRSSHVCRSCPAKKQQSGESSAATASAATPLNRRILLKDTATREAAAAAPANPYALRVRMNGSSCSDVPRLIAQLLVRLGQLDRRICLDFRPSVIAAAAVHIALLPRQGDPTQRFSPLSPAARAIAVKAVVAAGGAACYRLVRRCQSMLMHKWVKVRGAMAIVQRSNNGGSAADPGASGAATAPAGGSAVLGGAATASGTAASAGGRTGGSISLPERLVAEWALSRLTLPAHRHMLEVLHQLADIWTTYAAASIRSKAAAAVAAAAAAARKQQQQAQAAAAVQETTGTGAAKRAAADAQPEAPAASVKGAGGGTLPSKCSSSSTSMGGGGSHHYKHHYYHHRPGKSRSGTTAEELLMVTRKMDGETRRRTAAGNTASTSQGLLLPLLRKEEDNNGLGPKGKLLQPLNAALLKNTPSLHAAVSDQSINSFTSLAGLQKELRMMERATIGLRRLQKLSLEAAGRDDNRKQLLLQ